MANDKIDKAIKDALKEPMDPNLKGNLITGGILLAAAGAVKAYDYFKGKRDKKKKR